MSSATLKKGDSMAKEERIIEVDAATIETFLATYSADRIADSKGAKLKGIVEFEGKLYTCVGSAGKGEDGEPAYCELVEVIPKTLEYERWEEHTYTYAEKSKLITTDEERESFYFGIRVTYKKKEYMLGNPCKAIELGSRPAAVEPVRVKREKYTAMARYDFKEAALQGMAKDIARTVGLLASLEGEKKTLVSEYAAKINKAQAEVNELARMLNTGYEFRMIEHERVYDFNEMVVYVTRLDTFECTEQRAMTGQEAQMDIGFREDPEEPPAEETKEPEVDVDHAEGAEAEEPLGEGQEVPEAESTLGMSSAFPTEYEGEETTEGGEDIDRD